MLYDYLAMGGQEIVNSARAFGYASTADCPTGLLRDAGCDALDEALAAIGNGNDEQGYAHARIQTAPWYDPSLNDLSGRFMGVYGLSFEGFKNSTRRAEIVDRFSEGGVIGRQTRAARVVTVRALLVAQGRDAIDFGLEWLTAELDPGSCGQHGGRCGLTDLEFFDDCPPERGVDPDNPLLPEPLADYRARVNGHLRYLHDVAVTSGPLIVEERGSGDGWWVYEVEFTVGSEQAFIYSQTTEVAIRSDTTYIVQDQVENLVLNPSAEKRYTLTAIEKNHIINPSFETGVEGWFGEGAGGSVSLGRTQDVAAEGDWAGYAESQVLGVGDGEIPMSIVMTTSQFQPVGRTVPAGTTISYGIWSLLEVLSGEFEVTSMEILFGFSTGPAATFTQRETYSGAEIKGGVNMSGGIITPEPFDAYYVGLVLQGSGWQSSTIPADNTRIRLLADAVHLTIPEA